MRAVVGFFITDANINWCESEIDKGHYSTLSDIVEFALRDMLLGIREDYRPEKHRRGHKVRKSVRVEAWIMDSLLATGIFQKSELADYAIWYLRERCGDYIREDE